MQVAPLVPAKNIERLNKHLSLVLERLAKGMRLVAPGEPGAPSAAAQARVSGTGGPAGRPPNREEGGDVQRVSGSGMTGGGSGSMLNGGSGSFRSAAAPGAGPYNGSGNGAATNEQ